MIRKQIERGTIEFLKDILSKQSILFVKEVEDNPHRYFIFSLNRGDFVYHFSLRFYKPNFIKYNVNFSFSNNSISSLVQQINPQTLENNEEWIMCNMNLNDFLTESNKDSILHGFKWVGDGSLEAYVDNIPINKERLPIIAQEMYETFFKPVLFRIIPALNTLEKIDKILNNLPELRQNNSELPLLTSLWHPHSHQLVLGVILANYLNRPDKLQITDKYLKLAEEYGEDDYGYINLLHDAVKYFRSRKM
jgi:hypothetical protein